MAQFVVVAITLVGIYYQFRLQRAATTFEQLKRLGDEWASERMTRAKLATAQAIHSDDPVPLGPMALLADSCEIVASLVRQKHVSARAVYETLGPSIITWWVLLEPAVAQMRERESDPTTFTHFEWLANALKDLAVEDRVGEGSYDRARIVGELPSYIESWEQRIKLAEDSRASRSAPVRRKATR